MQVIELSKNKFDHGKILYQEKVAVMPDEDFVSLRSRLAGLGGQAIAHTLQNWSTLVQTSVLQAETGFASSNAPKLDKRYGTRMRTLRLVVTHCQRLLRPCSTVP